MTYHPEVAPIMFPIAFLVSAVLIGVGVWLRGKTKAFVKIAKATTGEIVGSQPGRTTSGNRTRYVLVLFVTEAGEEVVYESMLGIPWAGRKQGKQVPILYNPDDPQEARIRSFLELVLPWLIFLVTGILMMGTGLVALGYVILYSI